MRRGSRLALGLSMILVGCGKRGDPLPPLPLTPQAVQNLRVAQRGAHVQVSYVVPRATSTGGHLGLLEVELLRADVTGDFAKVSKRQQREKVAPGESRVHTEPLPKADTILRFAARAIHRGASSPLTAVALLRVQPEVPAPHELLSELVPDGARLKWTPPDPMPSMVVPPAPPTPKPTLPPASQKASSPAPSSSTGGEASPPPQATPSPPSPSPGPSPSPVPSFSPGGETSGPLGSPSAQTTPSSPSPSPGPSPSPSPSPRPGGIWVYRRAREGEYRTPLSPLLQASAFSDTTARPGESWCYVVRTVISAEPVIESADSNEACLDIKDITPPAPPSGLSALPREGVIELSWSPSREEDVSLYRVYRSEGDGAPSRLAEIPVPETSYGDKTVQGGVLYRYTLTAVDASGNESAPSSAAVGRMP